MPHPLRTLGLLALTLTASATLAVAPPPRPLGSPEVQRLIEQLGDRDYRARERAEKQLTAEGMPALPLLRKALGHHDAEVRRRALRLVPVLEHVALVAPKRVTLSVKNEPLRNILAQISKQTGYQIHHMGGAPAAVAAPAVAAPAAPAPVIAGIALPVLGMGKAPAGPKETTYSYTFVNEPFWAVLDRLCRDCNLSLQQGWGDESVRLYQGMGYAPHAGFDGAFRYAATGMQLWRNVDLNAISPAHGAAPSRNESLTLNFAVFAEPRLPFLGMGEPRLEAAYDSERNSMIPKVNGDPNNDATMMLGGRFGRRVYYNGGGYKQMSMQGSVTLQRVSEKATTIKLLRGVVPMTLLVEQRPVDLVDDVLKAKGKRTTVGELEFHIESAQKKPNAQFEVKFTITNKGNPNDYTWQNTLYQRLELLDAKGVKYQNWGSNWHHGGNNTVTLTMTYSGAMGGVKVGEPKRFVYQHWVTRQHDVHFEFRDVPLP